MIHKMAEFQPARIVRMTTKKGDHVYYGPYEDSNEAVRKANDLIDEFYEVDDLQSLTDPPVGYQIFYINVPKES